jgi:hypothetical protein
MHNSSSSSNISNHGCKNIVHSGHFLFIYLTTLWVARSGSRINWITNWKGCESKGPRVKFNYYSWIFQQSLRTLRITLIHDSRSQGWDWSLSSWMFIWVCCYLNLAVMVTADFTSYFSICTDLYGGTQWLRHCATSHKIAGSIPDGVGICHWHNPSRRTVALGSTQLLTEVSIRNISWG